MNAQQSHDTIVSDLGRTRSIKRQEAGKLNQQPGLTYNAPQQYYNGFPRKAEAYTHQMKINKKQGWQRQDTMQMLSAPMVHFRQDHFFKSVREAVRFGQQAKIPIKQRCMYNNLNFFRPIRASDQSAMTPRSNSITQGTVRTNEPMKGSERAALRPPNEEYINFMDEPMTERELALLKRKALQNNPRVLAVMKRLHQLAVALRQRQAADGLPPQNDPPAPPVDPPIAPPAEPQAELAGSKVKPTGDGDSGETKGNTVDTDSEQSEPSDDFVEGNIYEWVDNMVSQLNRAKESADDEPNGAKIDGFIRQSLPAIIEDSYDELGDTSEWTLQDFIEGLRSIVREPKYTTTSDELKDTLRDLRDDIRAISTSGSVAAVKAIFDKRGIKLPDTRQKFGKKAALEYIKNLMKLP